MSRPRPTDAGAGLVLRTVAMLAVGLAGLLAASTGATAEGDAARGARVFQRCYSCHSVDPNETGQTQGPSLYGVIGRRAASVAGFEYSDGMKAKGATGLTWTAAALDRFIADPEAFAPGTPMVVMPPLHDAQERADLIAYLSSVAR